VDFSRRIATDGNVAFLADNFDGGLKVINLRDPSNLQPFFQINIRGFCESVVRRGNLLAAGYRNYGVRLFRIDRDEKADGLDHQTTPSVRLLCTLSRSRTRVRDILPLANQLLVAANDTAGIELYDVHHPQQPVLLDDFEFDDPETAAQSLHFYDGHLYVPSWDGGLYILQIAREKPKGGRRDGIDPEDN
jgi:hypothetical protein